MWLFSCPGVSLVIYSLYSIWKIKSYLFIPASELKQVSNNTILVINQIGWYYDQIFDLGLNPSIYWKFII